MVGPLGNQLLFDWYSGTPPYPISPRDGIERVAGDGVTALPAEAILSRPVDLAQL